MPFEGARLLPWATHLPSAVTVWIGNNVESIVYLCDIDTISHRNIIMAGRGIGQPEGSETRRKERARCQEESDARALYPRNA